MILAMLIACGVHPVSLDDQNWLSGDLVEEYSPEVADVHIAAGTEAHDGWHILEVDYLDEDGNQLVIVDAKWTQADGDRAMVDTLNCADAVAVFDPEHYASQGCDSIAVSLDTNGDTMSGSFAVWNGARLAGAFSGPIAWDDWY